MKVIDEVLCSNWPAGHFGRDKEYGVLHGEVVGMLKKLLFTDRTYSSTSSGQGSGGFHPQLRRLEETVLATSLRAFSDKWADVVKECGRNVDLLVEGQATTPELIDAKLASGKYAAITLIYNDEYGPTGT